MRSIYFKCVLTIFAMAMGMTASSLFSQETPEKEKKIEKTIAAQINDVPALLKFFNRPVFVLRSTVFGYPPAERAKFIEERFAELIKQGKINTITSYSTNEGVVIQLDGELLMMVSSNDLDPFSKDSMEVTVERLVKNIQNVLDLIRRQRDPMTNLKGAGLTLGGLLVFILVIILIFRLQRWVKPKIDVIDEKINTKLKAIGALSKSIHIHICTLLNRLIFWFAVIFCTYTVLTFSLQQFPYTEPWGKKLGTYIFDIIGKMSSHAIGSLPDLFVAFIIFLITYWLVRLIKKFFSDVAQGTIELRWLDSDAATPTSKIIIGIIWTFAIVMAYPYIPGSNTNAFKGIGVFLGLLISLGASSMVGQVIGGMVLMYSRAMKVGDIVQINDNFGKVREIGFFSTKLRTMKNEEINIPNSLMMSSITKNYSRLAKTAMLIIHSSVTIGYDVPWRQVHALLIKAAEKTEGIHNTPKPFVMQKALGDFYVEYEINGYLEKDDALMEVMSRLNANIQDEFNDAGVQIMSPHFVSQPAEKVYVPKDKWADEPKKKA